MNTIVVDTEVVNIPSWVCSLDAFRRWADTEEFPEYGRVCWLDGGVWVDMSKEQFFSHNQVKGQFAIVLGALVQQERLGHYVHDGMFLTHPEADLSCKPDGIFFSHAARQTGRVTLVEGAREGYVELEGSPEMVLEVVSDSSVSKDTDSLRRLYHLAGIDEYWLVDARGQSLSFDILRRMSRGYRARRPKKGWLRSDVFGKEFQLQRQEDAMGEPEFTLLWREPQ